VSVLIKSFAAIFCGYACVRLNFISLQMGEMKAMGFYVGKIALPLLIFNTVVTADLGTVSWGLVASCNLPKLLGFTLAFAGGFGWHGNIGDRIATGAIFAFCIVASNDFAIGFPVIDALYPVSASIRGEVSQNMITYLGINALIANAVFLPTVLVLLQIAKSRSGNQATSTWAPQRVFVMVKDIIVSPVIFAVIVGVFWQVFGPLESVDGGKQLPGILNDIFKLFTSPFDMLALFLTGTAVGKLKVSSRVFLLVVGKVVFVSTLNFVMTTFLVHENAVVQKKFANFAYLYGSIATSSAPLVFSNEFTPHLSEDIASTIILGIILSGSSMFASSVIFAETANELDAVLKILVSSFSVVAVPCAVICLAVFFCGRKWFSVPPVNTFVLYVLATICYSVTSIFVSTGSRCAEIIRYEEERTSVFYLQDWVTVLYGFFQNACRGFIMLLQIRRLRGPNPHWFGPLVVLILSAAVGLFIQPNTLTEMCDMPKLRRFIGGTPIVTGVVLIFEAVIIWPLRSRFESVANVVAEPLWDQRVSSRDASYSEDLSGDSMTGLSAPLHPIGMHSVSGVMWVTLTLRVVLQTCLGVIVLLSHPSVKGGFLQALIVEHALEHSQLLLATILLLFNPDFKDPIRRLVKRENPIVVLPTSEASGEVRGLFFSIKDEARSLCTRRTVCWYRHRQASVEACQLVSLLVAHDATWSRGDAVQRARLLTRYGFLKQLSSGTNVFHDDHTLYLVLSDADFTELNDLSDGSFANAPVVIPSMITIGEEMIKG